MIRNRLLQLAFALLSLAVSASAQTVHTFTFGQFEKDSYTGMITGSAAMQILDGQPANCGIGYCGTIEVPYNDSPYWGLLCPQSWGFPNGCFLSNNNNTPATLSNPTFITQACIAAYAQYGISAQTVGCIDYESGTSDFVGYGLGVTASVTVWFKVNPHHYCGKGGCHSWYTNDETNGTGTTSYTP